MPAQRAVILNAKGRNREEDSAVLDGQTQLEAQRLSPDCRCDAPTGWGVEAVQHESKTWEREKR